MSPPSSSALGRTAWPLRSSSRGRGADTLGDLPQIVADGGLNVDELVFHHLAEYALDANWKVCVENYLECYHCVVAHPGFTDVIDVDHEDYRLESSPTFASHFAHVRAREITTTRRESTASSASCGRRWLLLPSEELIAVFQQWVSDGL